jgi:hypothetical protein
MRGIINISAALDIPNDAHMECRIGARQSIDVTFGTWEGGAELHFERYALERFVELATLALDEPGPADPKGPPLLLVSPGSEVRKEEN